MTKQNYAAAHANVRFSTKRYEQSPYVDKYFREDMLFGLYCRRFYPLSMGEDVIEQYWQLRRGVVMFDVPEKPLQIKGPDAITLLERVFTRRIDTLKTWRACYAIACTPQGGILMDGVLIRLAQDHFWYIQADGEFEQWLLAYAEDLDVAVSDPKSRVLQIQGPSSLELLRAAAGGVDDNFGYFHAGHFDFAGQQLLVSRTGWTGELGFEIYSAVDTDHSALWDHLVEVGKVYDLSFSSAEAMGIRRIEAGILDNGTDIDISMTPYEAGLGEFVDLSKHYFVGKKALQHAHRERALFGLSCRHIAPLAGMKVKQDEAVVGRMTTGAWTPYLEMGVGFVRFKLGGDWSGRELTLLDREGNEYPAEVVDLPFYDRDKKIPRGIETLENQPG